MASLPPRARLPHPDTALRWAQRGFAMVAVAAIAIYLYSNRAAVMTLVASAQLSGMAVSIAMVASLHLLVASGFHWAHLGLDVHRPYGEALASYFVRLPARYLPGGIWHTAARYVDFRARHVIGKRVLAWMFLAETGLVAVSGLVIAGVASRIWLDDGGSIPMVGALLVIAGIVLGGLLLAYARWMHKRLRPLRLALAGSLFGLNWIGLGIAFALYGHALGGSDLGACSVGVLASAYDFAGSVGYIAIFAPQGWGVSELVFGSLHACGSPLVTSVAALTGFRLVGFLADMLAYSAALGAAALLASVSRLRKSRQHSPRSP